MEKRRLFLVVMLLASSGALLASGEEGSDSDKPTAGMNKKQRAKHYAGAPGRKAKSSWRFVISLAKRPGKAVLSPITPAPLDENEDGGCYRKCFGWLGKEEGQKRASCIVQSVHFGVTVGLAVALYKTLKNEKVQKGAKALWRGASRVFRKKALEKRTDGAAIEKTA